VKKDGSQEKSSDEEKGNEEACKEEKEIKSLHTRTQKRLGKQFPSRPFILNQDCKKNLTFAFV